SLPRVTSSTHEAWDPTIPPIFQVPITHGSHTLLSQEQGSGDAAAATSSTSSSSNIDSEVSPPILSPSPAPPSLPPPPPHPSRPHPMITRSKNNIFKPKQLHLTTKHPLPESLEPTCVSQALRDSKWRLAMSEEFNALVKNHTWDLVPASKRQNIIGCKWVFRIKRNADGSINRYKARLVAKGFHQRPGLDYTETFSPVIKPTTIRVVLSLAVSSGWPIRQLDVSNAFLHGSIDEEVYMVQPPGFVDSNHPTHVCRLRKALYGLKQAPRAWYRALKNFLMDYGFMTSKSDASLFVFTSGNTWIYFLVYVDDLLVTGNDSTAVQQLINALSSRFSIKDLGMLHYFLGVEAAPTSTGLFLSQHKYIRELLERTDMAGAKEVNTPMSCSASLLLHDGSPPADATEFRRVVGSLQYLSLTRPDIAFSVNKLSQYMHAPTQNHWTAVKRLLRYLKQTIFHGLHIKRQSSITLKAYSDADWAGDKDDRVSTSGYLVYLGANPISWSSKKQRSVARSSTEAEYRAVATTAAELAWVQSLLQELGVSSSSPTIYCDNIGVTSSCSQLLGKGLYHIHGPQPACIAYLNPGPIIF
ncbi:hypothetical protein CRG98_035241, partial [Punica granatum]